MSALPLFDDRERASRFDPPEDITSRKHGGNPESEAAHEDAKGRKHELHTLILYFVRMKRGATCWEISQGCEIPYQTCSARVSELKRTGQLVPTGEKRRTYTGSMAAVLAVRG